jgi:hypothetical protein
MKSILVVLSFIFASPVLAQDSGSAPRAAAGCGPSQVQFDVKANKNLHTTAQPEPGKALIYVFEEERRDSGTTWLGSVTTRVGLDGSWAGANHGKSYVSISADPGEHRLCTDWQSSLKTLFKVGSAATLTAEAGKIYYYRTIVYYPTKEREPQVKLEPLDSAEGQFLISSSAFSRFQPKK